MKLLEQRILQDGIVKEGNILKVDSFLNHQIDVKLMNEIGKEVKRLFGHKNITKILTIEASGIAAATIIAQYFDVPVLFAKKAKSQNPEAAKRILIKGDVEVSLEAAKVFASSNILLLGNESQTVGPPNAPMAVHLALLGADVTLLEGIRLSEVPEGVYLLCAAPLNLAGADGAPCRAILINPEG